jgi:hypothetical protein
MIVSTGECAQSKGAHSCAHRIFECDASAIKRVTDLMSGTDDVECIALDCADEDSPATRDDDTNRMEKGMKK